MAREETYKLLDAVAGTGDSAVQVYNGRKSMLWVEFTTSTAGSAGLISVVDAATGEELAGTLGHTVTALQLAAKGGSFSIINLSVNQIYVGVDTNTGMGDVTIKVTGKEEH